MSSGTDPNAIGLQHSAFKTPKADLLGWINDFYELDYKEIADGSDGAIYCQIVDSLFPDDFSREWKKVRWDYVTEVDRHKNWKLLQVFFTKKKITRKFDISQIVDRKAKANLEMMQWMKYYFDYHYAGKEYDAPARRKGKQGKKKNKKTTDKSKKDVANPDEVARLVNVRDGLEKERDFYFGKLRQIEMMLQAMDDKADEVQKSDILKILYEVDEDFEQPDNDTF